MRYRSAFLLASLGARGVCRVLGFWVIIAVIIAMLVSCGPAIPYDACVKSHSEMRVVAMPGTPSVGGVNVGSELEVAFYSICDTVARFDTLGREIPHTRRKLR